MPVGRTTDGKKKSDKKKKANAKKGLSADGRKYTMKTQHKRDKASKQAAARKRHDQQMRATGRKELATNYGTKKGDKKKKKN